MYLQKKQILELIKSDKLHIRPLLDKDQIGELTIDFRLGYDFLVSIQGREAFIDTSLNDNEKVKSFESFFHRTRRRPGETFLLHPGQTILGTSLEYIKLPENILMALNMRSSYSRLGLSISTIVQPGYCGCISIELTNVNKNPINLTVGARIFQARLIKLENNSSYFNTKRKYMCQVRPMLSSANKDLDLIKLNNYWKDINNVI
ncbi:MAG: dCTP deaminase [Bacteroidetes bacterium]|nr:MAG: dCTP deaminase [Bacteroidota bacterium]